MDMSKDTSGRSYKDQDVYKESFFEKYALTIVISMVVSVFVLGFVFCSCHDEKKASVTKSATEQNCECK